MAIPDTQPLDIKGRCLCGDVSYHARGQSHGIIHCYCERCRKHSGAAFVSYVMFKEGRLKWLSGKDSVLSYATELTRRSFCPNCATYVPYPYEDETRLSNMTAGTFLKMEPPRQEWHLFTESRCPWTAIPPGVEAHETVAPEYLDQHPVLPTLERALDEIQINGSCLCGTVSYSCINPIGMMNCHCSRCRLSRAAAHATNLFVRTSDFNWRSGSASVRHFKVKEAERFTVAFCEDCGSLVPKVREDRVNIPAGGLDTDPGITPAGHIHVASKAPWYQIRDDLPQWQAGYTA